MNLARKYGNMGSMKTTIELPDTTFRRAKALAAGRGMTLKRFFTDAVELHLGRHTSGTRANAGGRHIAPSPPNPPWMQGFGELADLGDEHRTVLEAIEEEFEKLDPGDMPSVRPMTDARTGSRVARDRATRVP